MPSSSDAPANSPRVSRAEAVWTVVPAAAALALYLATLCPTVYTLDAPELTAAAATFGVAHPPGYPLFTMVYGALARVMAVGDLALRTNVVSALVAAVTVGVTFRCGRAIGASRAGAAAGALGMAVARGWWAQGISTEVYALDGLLLAVAFLATTRVVRDQTPRSWSLLGLTFGLACGHRAVNVFYLLALLVWCEMARRRAATSPRCYKNFVVAGLATTAVWLYLPLAAALDPPMNMGNPSDPSRLWIVLSAVPYARHLASTELGLILGRVADYAVIVPVQLAATGAAALAGVALLHRGGTPLRAAGLSTAAFAALNLLFVVIYNVSDGETFLQATWIAAGVLSAVGYDALARRLGTAGRAVVIGLALAPAVWTYSIVDLSGVTTMDRYGRDLLDSAQPGALIVAFDDSARNAMVFQQVVRGYGVDRAVVDATAPLPWHHRETSRRTRDFDFQGSSGEGWIAHLAAQVARDPSRGLYLTDIEGVDLSALLGPELVGRAVQVPTGLLYRIVIPSSAPNGTSVRLRIAADVDARFWRTYELDIPRHAFHDPQLASVIVRSAQARFLLAVTYVLHGHADKAAPHFEALTTFDVDALEALVVADLATIGRRLSPWRVGARSRRTIDAIRRGAPQDEIMRALAPE